MKKPSSPALPEGASKRVPVRTRLFFRPDPDNGTIAVATASGRHSGSVWWRPTGAATVELELIDIDRHLRSKGVGEALLREWQQTVASILPGAMTFRAMATSRGIIRLLQRVFGREIGAIDDSRLPSLSPPDYLSTRNRITVRFRFSRRGADSSGI